jgi:23S rRNA pseudouridine2605 synthase
MPLRKNNSGKSSGPFKKSDGRKPAGSYKKTAGRSDSNSKFGGRDSSYKKPRTNDDSNELAPPRFLPPRDGNKSYGRKGPESRGGKPSGRPYGGDRDDRSFKSDTRKPSYPRSEEGGSRPPYKKREGGYGDSDFKKPSYPRSEEGGSRPPYKKREGGYGDSDFKKPSYPRSEEGGSRPPYKKREGGYGDSDFKKPSYPRNSEEGNGRAPYKKREDSARDGGYKKPGFNKGSNDAGGYSPYKKREGASDEGGYKKSGYSKSGDQGGGYSPYKKREASEGGYNKPSFDRKDDGKAPYKKREGDSRDSRDNNGYAGKSNYRRNADDQGPKRPFKPEGEADKPFRPKYDPQVQIRKSYSDRKKELTGTQDSPDDIRLNKYIANSGVCSRREADDVIKQGLVSINGTVVIEMGYRVKKGDVVKFDGRKILPEPFVYILMNKPKDFITTTDDEKGRKTVVDLLADKIPQRVYPIGRLDRNTTGVLLLTNDGDVAQALTHPSFQIKKVYHAVLDKKVSGTDLDKLVEGVELEDGVVHADAVAFVDNEDKRHVGVEIHSGKNRVVRRMFEHLGYDVEKLDRVSMGIFTKKDLPRGKWRFLKESEIGFLMKLKANMP